MVGQQRLSTGSGLKRCPLTTVSSIHSQARYVLVPGAFNSFIIIFSIFYFFIILCALVFCLHAGLFEGGSRLIDSCQLSCGCWELNPGPLEEQPVS